MEGWITLKYEIVEDFKGRYKKILVSLTRYEALNLIADLSTSMASQYPQTCNLIEYDRANMGDVLHFSVQDVEQHELHGLSKDEKAKAEYEKVVGKP